MSDMLILALDLIGTFAFAISGATLGVRKQLEKRGLEVERQRGIDRYETAVGIAKRVAREGARVALLAKTDQPHPKLEGTIHTAVEEINETQKLISGVLTEQVAVTGGIPLTVNGEVQPGGR